MANPHHIDLLKNQTGDVVGATFKLKAGSNGLFLGGVFDGCTVTLEHQPAGSTRFYTRPAGIFTVAGLVDTQFWVNSALSEGSVRGTITGAGAGTDIEEFLLRPEIEYEYEV